MSMCTSYIHERQQEERSNHQRVKSSCKGLSIEKKYSNAFEVFNLETDWWVQGWSFCKFILTWTHIFYKLKSSYIV